MNKRQRIVHLGSLRPRCFTRGAVLMLEDLIDHDGNSDVKPTELCKNCVNRTRTMTILLKAVLNG